jgi:hypothetical protein
MKEIQLRNPHRVSLITTVAGVLDVRTCAPVGGVVGVQVLCVWVCSALVSLLTRFTQPVGMVQTQTVLTTTYPGMCAVLQQCSCRGSSFCLSLSWRLLMEWGRANKYTVVRL